MSQHFSITYESEIQDTLNRLSRENAQCSSFSWFLDRARLWYDRTHRKTRKSSVTILGCGVPEELVLAAGAKPCFIMGGSLRSGDWSDDIVPRDTDPVSRSILGFLMDPDAPDDSDTLFIIPVQNDSLRKACRILEKTGKNLHVVDIPPVRNAQNSFIKWQEQMLRMTDAVACHTGTHLTSGRLKRSIQDIDRARKTFREFQNLSRSENLLTGSARILIQNSYYYTGDPVLWTSHLNQLNEELRRIPPDNKISQKKTPGILLLGSPVFFPNYKIPFLIEEIGMSILRTINPTFLPFTIGELEGDTPESLRSLIRASADRWYRHDGSSAFTENQALYQNVQRCLNEEPIEGVIYHVLKGQIEYDFELERFEAMFDKRKIPVFRLETDYQYQDLEQLRIRLEAFSEMLLQNRYREGQLI